MTRIDGQQLADFLEEKFGDTLRSVVHYGEGRYEFLYVRDDVAAQYTDEEIERIVRDLEMESMGKPVEETRFVHGELACRIHVFDRGVEMNFMSGDGEGVAVGLDGEAFVTHGTFVGRCLEVAGLG